MANKVSPEEIERINEIYYHCGSYAETARAVGRTPATVKRYIDPHWAPVLKVYDFNKEKLPRKVVAWAEKANWERWLTLDPEELKLLKEAF